MSEFKTKIGTPEWFIGKVVECVQILYCSIIVNISYYDENGKLCIAYFCISQYPPTSHFPQVSSIPPVLVRDFNENEQTIPRLSRKDFEKWLVKSKFAKNNFCTTSTNFLSGLFIGDKLTITECSAGFNNRNGNYIPESENEAFTLTIEYNGKSYKCYSTDKPYAQVAIDIVCCIITKSLEGKNNIKFIVLKRGESDNVDCPHSFMFSAGEHVEPGKKEEKEAWKRAIYEEIGITPEQLKELIENGIDINLRSYKFQVGEYFALDRDPRYSTYETIILTENGEQKKVSFGYPRGSFCTSHLLCIFADNISFGNPLDTEEVNGKLLVPREDVLELIKSNPMIPAHIKMLEDVLIALDSFLELSDEEKEVHMLKV